MDLLGIIKEYSNDPILAAFEKQQERQNSDYGSMKTQFHHGNIENNPYPNLST